MDSGRSDRLVLLLRWVMALVGWGCWIAAAMAPSQPPLLSIYSDVFSGYRSGQTFGVPASIQLTLALFVLAACLFALSPVMMVMRTAGWLPRTRWIAWVMLGVMPMTTWVMARFGPLLPLFLMGLSYLLVCLAIVRWPWENEKHEEHTRIRRHAEAGAKSPPG